MGLRLSGAPAACRVGDRSPRLAPAGPRRRPHSRSPPARCEQSRGAARGPDRGVRGAHWLTALRELGVVLPNVRVLILTVHAERERLVSLLDAGARGYLSKEAASRDLVEAIRVVAAGEVYVRPAAARLLAAAVVSHRAAETAQSRFQTLSDRERTMLRLVAEGYSGAEIARRLAVSSKTVDAYKRRVEEKLGLGHRTDCVRFAIEAGVLGS
ncbi:MAG TPA: response regulator transcription factor [Gemmatimonadales bacterium]|nr:response regulator transcription factor [Gemmatimonadales bacterium]